MNYGYQNEFRISQNNDGYPKIGVYFRISIIHFWISKNRIMDIQYSTAFWISKNVF